MQNNLEFNSPIGQDRFWGLWRSLDPEFVLQLGPSQAVQVDRLGPFDQVPEIFLDVWFLLLCGGLADIIHETVVGWPMFLEFYCIAIENFELRG